MPNVYEVQPTNENGDLVSLVTRTSTIYDNNGNPIGGFATENELCEAYEPTKTYPTYSKYCIYNNAFYKYTGTGTSTGAFDSTKWTLTNFAEVGQTLMGTADISAIGDGSVTGAITTLNSTLAGYDLTDISTLFTSKSSLIDRFYAYKQGNMVYVQFRMNISSTSPLNNRTQLAVVDTNIMPKLWVTADVKDIDGRNQNGGIWLERGTNQILYTGDNLTTSGSNKFYVTFSYMIFD